MMSDAKSFFNNPIKSVVGSTDKLLHHPAKKLDDTVKKNTWLSYLAPTGSGWGVGIGAGIGKVVGVSLANLASKSPDDFFKVPTFLSGMAGSVIGGYLGSRLENDPSTEVFRDTPTTYIGRYIASGAGVAGLSALSLIAYNKLKEKNIAF